ncbi:DUF5677 domain-containing protein [Nubsella zeaxanthinifaciens]|uniref:DUF5677 domain-containing protein n=1 Tax=Nubsella zeaxanthinifaciens TaxID=392412 RepID=UPI003CFD8CCB
MRKFNDLVIDNLGNITNHTLETARSGLGISKSEFRKLLNGQNNEIFEIIDNTLSDFILDQINQNYLQVWLEGTAKNQKTIVNEFPDFFRYYFIFVHAANKIFGQIEKETVGKTADIKEITLFCMLGNLCRMSDEIGVLLTNGSTKAALALWRVFYEYTVVGVFLMEHDSTELFERYADHGQKNVDKQKNSFMKHFEDLKFKPLTDLTIQEIESKSTELKEKYGNDFLGEYAWAKPVFEKDKKRINFFDIELKAGMNRYRPFYIWASGVVHPTCNSMTDYFNQEGKLIIGEITCQKLDLKSYIDPAQLTVVVFYSFLNYFLYEYSADEEYDTNVLVLRKIIERLKDTFPEERETTKED